MEKLKELWKKYEEAISYLFWGGVAFFLSMALFYVFANMMHMDEQVANSIDWVICVVFTYFTNRTFVFKSKSSGLTGMGKEFISFIGARLGTLIIENIILFVTIDMLTMNNMIAKLIGQFVVIVSNYILSKLWIFKKKG
ncbi:MAG: GtrA family protein [Lachnospiraceae bacterium]|nr:GtrA family protein [Lachnospiraceae bacterium]